MMIKEEVYTSKLELFFGCLAAIFLVVFLARFDFIMLWLNKLITMM